MDNIGEILKNTRLDKGLSLEQVEEATSIRKIYLAAIETGDYAKIPGDVFTKGIIRTYGNYLGLNGPELVTLYKAACAGVDPEEIKPAEIRTTSKISVAPHLKPQKNSSNIFTYLLSFVLLVIIAAAGYIFLFSSSDQPENIVTPKQSALSDDTAKSNEIPEQEKAKIEADAKKAKERAEQAAAAKAQKTPADNKQVQQKQQAVPDKNNLNLYMFCNDRCWVEVTVDGNQVKMTPIEFKILHLLMKNAGRVFSSEEIYERVWNEQAINTDTIMVHIRNIREKIEINPKNPKYLKVVWGVGYKIEKQ